VVHFGIMAFGLVDPNSPFYAQRLWRQLIVSKKAKAIENQSCYGMAFRPGM